MTGLVILGGSDAGISAALRAKEMDPRALVTVVLADSFPNYSICGLPFYLSGEVSDWHELAHRTANEITDAGIALLLDHTAQTIDIANRVVSVVSKSGQKKLIGYDRLVIATGAESVRPLIPGLEIPGVFLLRSMEDAFAVHEYLVTHAPRSAIIIGGGYIGMEMADALTLRGISVSVVEHAESILKTIDASLGKLVSAELERYRVQVITSVRVERIIQRGMQLQVEGSPGFSATADLVLVAVGVKPSIDLAQSTGIGLGEHNAIRVNRKMETNVSDIYAAGDCVETWHRLLNKSTYLPLGTTAHKQGRIAGENALGGQREFAGTIGTQVVKVFDLVVARTGLREAEAEHAGFVPHTIEMSAWDHKVYYPGAQKIWIRLTGDQATGRLLGAQMVGHMHTEIAKRVDVFATALYQNMRVDELNDLDLSYTPPLSSPWDPIQMSAQTWTKDTNLWSNSKLV